MNKYFVRWYRPEYSMSSEDWLYIAYMLLAGIIASGLGLLLGIIWSFFI
jgi:hypothetical protein